MSRTAGSITPVLVGLAMAALAALGIIQATTAAHGESKPTDLSQYGAR